MLKRRTFLAATAVAAGAIVSGCTRGQGAVPATNSLANAIAEAEAKRPHTGRQVSLRLAPKPTVVDLGGPKAATLAYGDTLPGPLVRADVGDEVVVTVANGLTSPTSAHWHGIALRNDMDGVAPATPDIAVGAEFEYRFTAPHPGTYWAHPHVGLQADDGLYLPVIIDDPADPGDYDAEWIVVLDDWTDGVGKSPTEIFDSLKPQGPPAGDTMPGMPGMGSMSGVGTSALLGGDAGDVDYPYYLVNGRIPDAPTTFTAKPGQRIRIRIINSGADTAFRVALDGHQMSVTHTDGFPIDPVDVDALLIGMAERYDVIVTAKDGVFPLVAQPEGKNGVARALLSTGRASVPPTDYRPGQFDGKVGTVDLFVATAPVSFRRQPADTTITATLTGGMAKYDWGINGVPYPTGQPLMVSPGQRVNLVFANQTTMWHPMHLHGHTFQMVRPDGTPGARKDTAIILPKQTVTTTFVADNPGIWMLHCHNAYHQEGGMMTTVEYAL